MSTQMIQTPEVTSMPEVFEPGDHERLSHYVDKDAMMEALLNGTPTTALCGKRWVPTRDGMKFPVCPECAEIFETLKDE